MLVSAEEENREKVRQSYLANPSFVWEKAHQNNHPWAGENEWAVRSFHLFQAATLIRLLIPYQKWFPAPVLHCDLGTGDGIWKREIQALFPGVVTSLGVDFAPSAEGVDILEDITSSDFSLASPMFHLVTAINCLRHIVEDSALEQALVNIHRMLRPGGFFIFSWGGAQPKKTPIWYKLRDWTDWYEKVKGAGFSGFSTHIFDAPDTFTMTRPTHLTLCRKPEQSTGSD